MAISGIHSQLREKLFGHAYHDINDLASQEANIDKLIQEKEKECANRGRRPHLVSIIDIEEFDD